MKQREKGREIERKEWSDIERERERERKRERDSSLRQCDTREAKDKPLACYQHLSASGLRGARRPQVTCNTA